MITLNCICGKKLKVKDELAGKKIKCPGCASVNLVPVPVPDGPIGLKPLDDEPAEKQSVAPGQEKPDNTVPCPTCQSRIPPESFTCPKCNVKLKDDPANMDSPVVAIYKKIRPYIPIIVGIIVIGIALLMMPKPKREEPKKPPVKPKTQTTVKPAVNAVKEPAGPKPEDNLRAEIKNGDVMDLEVMATLMATLQDKSLGVLAAEARNSDVNIKLKAVYGLYFFSYFKCYRKEIFKILDTVTGNKPADDKTRMLVPEMLYLMQTDAPLPQYLSLTDFINPHAAKFEGVVTQTPLAPATAKMLIQKYTSDKNDLIKAKALIFTIMLGDRHQVRALFPLFKSADTAALDLVKSYLNELTGQSFEKPEEWEAWYKTNKDKIQFDKK
ncbi:MAG: zinc ribbon domain-containing protein [Planctomycetota bacterium]